MNFTRIQSASLGLLLAAGCALAQAPAAPVRVDGAWARAPVTGQTGTGAFMATGAYATYNFMLRLPELPLPASLALGGVIAAPLPPLMPEPIPGPLVRKY